MQKRFGGVTPQNPEDDKYILFGDFVQPICLPTQNNITTSNSHKRRCKFSGWTGGRSGEHYLVGHAAEINNEYVCQDRNEDTTSSKPNCLSVQSFSPPNFSTEKDSKKRKSVSKEKESSYENGMPLVCFSPFPNQPHLNQKTSQNVDKFELIGLYSSSKVENDNRTRLKTRKKDGERDDLVFLNILPYIPWIQIRLSL